MMESPISLAQQLVIALQVLLAAFLSMVVGFNRERRDKDAGLRTHMLVGTGACVFSALSILVFPESESARVAANVVTGVGFLGAGVIWRGDGRVHELTTAASIWIVAAIGMAVGLGAWFLALCITIVVWVILEVLWRLRNETFE
jgi:putative Mg2+ transporter-C (MgtC) family protein